MMMIDHARGKINLTLDITGKREDSYHELDMILQSVELSDTLVFETMDDIACANAPKCAAKRKAFASLTGFTGSELYADEPEQVSGKDFSPEGVPVIMELEAGCEGIPEGPDNLIIKAAKAVLPYARKPHLIRIVLEKNIPTGAGMGGGSSDAACVMRALSGFWDCDLTEEDLLTVAANVGADVPFLIMGGCCECTGIGEKLRPLQGLYDVAIALLKPKISLSTPKVYGRFDELGLPGRSDTAGCAAALEAGDERKAASLLGNALEGAAADLYPPITEIKELFLREGAMGAAMTGSGSAVYGLFRDKRKAFAAVRRIKEELGDQEIKSFLTTPALPEDS